MGKFYDFGPNLAKNLENSTIEVGGLAALWTAHGSTQHIRVPPPTGPDQLKKGLIYSFTKNSDNCLSMFLLLFLSSYRFFGQK